MSVLYLVRHGQGSFGTDNYDLLSPVGREQAEVTGEHFAEMGETITSLYSGSMMRQQETAQLLATRLFPDESSRPAIAIDPAFNEYDADPIFAGFAASLSPDERARAGWPELKTDRRKFQFFLERAALAWVRNEVVHPKLEPWRDFHGRAIGALERLMQREGRGKTVIVSTSGGVIGTIVAHVLGIDNHIGMVLNWSVHNASLTRLMFSEGKVTLSMFNALPQFERVDRKRLITYR
jgi:broad specificity phosphatase PhoE